MFSSLFFVFGNVLKHHLLIHISVTWISLLALHIGDSLLLFLSKWWYWYFSQYGLWQTPANIHSRPSKVIVMLWQPSPQMYWQKPIFVQILWWMESTGRLDCESYERKWFIWRGILLQFQFHGFDCLLSGSVVLVFFFFLMSNNKNKYSSN